MTDLDRVKRVFRGVLRAVLDRLDRSALYTATVVAQNDDGSVDIRSSVPDRPHLSKVPIQYGVPGLSLQVKPGASVLIGFLNADRGLPYVLVRDQASVESISILKGTKAVARLGDGVRVILPSLTTYTGTIGTVATPAPVPVQMANAFIGVITSGQVGAQA